MGDFVIFPVLMILIALQVVQVSLENPQWQQIWFCIPEGSLINEVMTLRNMDDRKTDPRTFQVTEVPFYKNHPDYLIFVKNETCVELLTKDTADWIMEYGGKTNGDGLQGLPGDWLNEMSVRAKIAEYKRLSEGTDQPAKSHSRNVKMVTGLVAGAALFVLILIL